MFGEATSRPGYMEAGEHCKAFKAYTRQWTWIDNGSWNMKREWTEGEVMPHRLVGILKEELVNKTSSSDSDLDSDREISEGNFLDKVGSESDTEINADDY